ncbi:hypothetical protein [Caenimonas sp. SL110]|uniref:hypothetical protein n=1 Tax=Caenimonas sp. SL110 TaxID=1450524 RepID=UPI00065459F1|nr:hypothetical protein [Caenimonas sp. SL110]
MLAPNHESQLATPLAAAGGDFAFHLVFSGLTTALLTLAIDSFAGGLGIGTLLGVALAIALPLAVLAAALGNSPG